MPFTHIKVILFGIFFVLIINISGSCAVFLEDYLWLEFKSEVKNADGSLTQPLIINYGNISSLENDTNKLDNLEAFYTFGEKDKTGADIFYKLNINTDGRKKYVNVNSEKVNWCAVTVRGNKKYSSLEYDYTAQTSFFVFGNSSRLISKKNPSYGFKKQFNIEVYRERIKEYDTLYRRIGYPIRFRVLFEKKPFRNKSIKVVDNFGEITHAYTAMNGDSVYIPKKQGKIRADLLLAEYKIANCVYKIAHTVLFKHSDNIATKRRELDLRLGFFIFICATFISLICIMIARKAFVL